MEIFGIGPLELIYILLIALIVLGPKDMVKAGRTLGKFLRRIVTSSSWRTVQHASQEFRQLPNKLIRDAGLEEFEQEVKEINKITKSYLDDVKMNKMDLQEFEENITSWTTPPASETSSDPPSNSELETASKTAPVLESSSDTSSPSNKGEEESSQDFDHERE